MKHGSIENSMGKQSGSERFLPRALSPSKGFLPMALGVALASLFAAAPAAAEPTFPGVLVDKAGAVCIVTCLTCHTDPAGGKNNLKLPFGAAFGAAVKGLELSGSVASLDSFKNSDADGDGDKDLNEVLAGHDPTSFGSASICVPTYGCGARIASRAPLDGGAAGWLLTAAAACVYVGRRRFRARGR